ncbi:hypothetical protein BGW42_005883 [Actinomortierella wolfii]|nr:hypothetical protein BGW42_005883 [Actinomortierella wolfii]
MEVDLVPPSHVGHDPRTSTLQPSVRLSFRMGGKRPRPINDEFFDEGELEYKLAWQRLNHHNVYIPAVEGFDPSKDDQTAAPWKAEASPSFDDNDDEPGNTHKIQTASGGNPRLTQDQESAYSMDGDTTVRPSSGMDMEIDQLQANLSKLKLPKAPKTHAPVDRPKMQPGFYRGPPISMNSQLQSTNLTESSPSAIPVPSATSRSNTWMVPRQVKTSKALPRPTRTPVHRNVSME